MIINLEQNKGIADALNVGIKTALSLDGIEFIARMDADDISLSTRI